MADPTDEEIAQSGVDPRTGSYLSAERRKALFKSTRISSGSAFGGGGSLAPIRPKPYAEPETLSIVKAQNNSITTIQSDINEIKNQQEQFSSSFRDFEGLRTQVSSINQNIGNLNNELITTAQLISNNELIESERIRQEQYEQRRIAEEGLRESAIAGLEQKIQRALVRPIESLGKQTQGVLDSVMEFFGTLLAGWLTNQAIDSLKARSEDSQQKLSDIRDNVLTALGIAGKTLLLINQGFLDIAKSLTSTAAKLGKFLVSGVIGGIFKGLGNLANAVKDAGKNLLGAAGKAASKTGSEVAESAVKKGGGIFGSFDDIGKGLLQRLTPGLGTIINTTAAAYRYSKGDEIGAALSLLSSVPVAGWPVMLTDVARDFGAFEGTFLGKSQETKRDQTTPTTKVNTQTSQKLQPEKEPPAAKSTQPTATPMQSMIPDIKFGVDTENKIKAFEDNTEQSKPDLSQPAKYGEISITPQENQSLEPSKDQTSPQIKIPVIAANTDIAKSNLLPMDLGPLQEPKPNVIYRQTSSGNSQASPQVPLKTGNASEVPAISSSNSDNMYLLYSQINYNVVV